MTAVEPDVERSSRLSEWDITHVVCCDWHIMTHSGAPLIAFCGVDVTGQPEGDGALCIGCAIRIKDLRCPYGGICPNADPAGDDD